MDGGVQRYQDYHLLGDHSIDVKGRMSTDDDCDDKLKKEEGTDDSRFRLVVLGSLEDTMAMTNLLYRESKTQYTQDDTKEGGEEVPYHHHDTLQQHSVGQE